MRDCLILLQLVLNQEEAKQGQWPKSCERSGDSHKPRGSIFNLIHIEVGAVSEGAVSTIGTYLNDLDEVD